MARIVRFAACLLFPCLAGSAGAQLVRVGAEFQVNTYFTAQQVYASVAVDPTDAFVVVWQSGIAGTTTQDGSDGGIFGQRFSSNGARLGTEFQVNTYTTQNQNRPKVAIDPAGDFLVVWESLQPGSQFDIFGQRFSSSGARLGGEFRVNSSTVSFDRNVSLAYLPGNDQFVAVWQKGSTITDVMGQRFDSAGNRVGSEFLVNSYTPEQDLLPAVAAYDSGGFVVVWASGNYATTSLHHDGSGYGIFGQRFDSSGARVGAEFQVNTYTTGNQRSAVIDTAPGGAFVVVWDSTGQDGSLSGSFGQRFDSSGARVGTEFQVSTYTSNFQGPQSVATDATGGFLVTFAGTEGPSGSAAVKGQLFDNAGARVGTELQINTYTSETQTASTITADSNGFVIAWQSFRQDGDERGIFAQRFDVTIAATATPTTTPTATPTPTDTPIPPSATATSTATHSATPTASATSTLTGTFTPVASSTATPTSAAANTATATVTATSADTSTATPSITATATPTATASATPTCDPLTSKFPCEPTATPTFAFCPPVPADGCAEPQRASLAVKSSGEPDKDRVVWKWLKGSAPVMELGDPTTTASFALCVYDDAQLAVEARVGPSSVLWRRLGDSGFAYRDVTAVADGFGKVLLKGGEVDRGKLLAKLRGAEIPLPAPVSANRFFQQADSVTVELRNQAGTCWQSRFAPASTLRNDSAQFKAKL